MLGLPPAVLAADEAEKAYSRAERLMIKGDSAGAVEDFKKIARQYPRSPLASRSLYAAGWIYENRLFNRDSAIASYTKLIALYPASPYAVRIAAKITEVNLKLKQAAAPDSSASRPAVRPPVRLPVPGIPDTLQRREEVFVPKQNPAVTDTNEVRRIPNAGPKKLPEKEGPTP
jgi:tetratricopeptide (TPR) repeat protein